MGGNPKSCVLKILCRRTLRQLFAWLGTLSLHRFHGLIIYNIDTKAKCCHLKTVSKYCPVGSPTLECFICRTRCFGGQLSCATGSVPKCHWISFFLKYFLETYIFGLYSLLYTFFDVKYLEGWGIVWSGSSNRWLFCVLHNVCLFLSFFTLFYISLAAISS